jgi:hypothetical protein
VVEDWLEGNFNGAGLLIPLLSMHGEGAAALRAVE